MSTAGGPGTAGRGVSTFSVATLGAPARGSSSAFFSLICARVRALVDQGRRSAPRGRRGDNRMLSPGCREFVDAPLGPRQVLQGVPDAERFVRRVLQLRPCERRALGESDPAPRTAWHVWRAAVTRLRRGVAQTTQKPELPCLWIAAPAVAPHAAPRRAAPRRTLCPHTTRRTTRRTARRAAPQRTHPTCAIYQSRCID